MKKQLLGLTILMLIIFAFPGFSQEVPNLIDYQGKITDNDGNAVNGIFSIEFLIYEQNTGGNLIWSEVNPIVNVTDGLFHVLLGSVESLPQDMFSGSDRWIAINVEGDGEMTPRSRIGSVPYAMVAGIAPHDDDWVIDGDTICHENGNVGIGTLNPTEKLEVDGKIKTSDGVHVTSAGDDGVYVYNAGNPSTQTPSSYKNGFEVAGAEGDGLYIGRADNYGVNINSAGDDGVHISSADLDGVRVNSAGDDGVFVSSAGAIGFRVSSAGNDGFNVYNAGNPSTQFNSFYKNGFEVAGAEGHGLMVGQADENGIYVYSTGKDGIRVEFAGNNGVTVHSAVNNGVLILSADADGVYVEVAGDDGVYVKSAGTPSTHQSSNSKNGFEIAGAESYGLYIGYAGNDGVYIYQADDDGVWANTTDENHEYGIYTTDKMYASWGYYPAKSGTFCMNTGSSPLEQGDLVCISGGYEKNVPGEDGVLVINIEKANTRNSEAIFGVVEYKVYICEEVEELEDGKTEIRKSFRHADGNVMSGDYLAIIVFGPADVKVDSRADIIAGEKMTVSDNGDARSINDKDNWRIGILGKALEDSNGKDKIKVYVNCK